MTHPISSLRGSIEAPSVESGNGHPTPATVTRRRRKAPAHCAALTPHTHHVQWQSAPRPQRLPHLPYVAASSRVPNPTRIPIRLSSHLGYAVAGALGIIVFIGAALFVRSRIDERRHPSPVHLPGDDTSALNDRPRLFDTYLGAPSAECSWSEIMPLSLHRVGAWPQTPTKNVSMDGDVLAVTLSAVAALIAMPHPHPRPLPSLEAESPREDPWIDAPLPPLEIGVIDVAVPR
ncbi:hypothetical protein FB451DRAFT_1261199 [Mycena latifolia]|nr:hypothetical protein FB451DRAFT_1261199 [Mycena latifolia]